MPRLKIGGCEEFTRKKWQSPSLNKGYNGDQLQIGLHGLGPEEENIKYRKLQQLRNFSRS
jgi:hypothetical protein